jgi:hypothetical protein
MAVKVKGLDVKITGKDAVKLQEVADRYGMSVQDTFTGLMWEAVMNWARQGIFKGESK